MASLEVAGLILGGFALVVSAMEHASTMEKLGRKWTRAHQEHKRDLGRLRDCELNYRLNMRRLLAPFELNNTLDSATVELLLTDLDSSGWCTQDVDDVLCRRLGECKERYFANLQEMNQTIVKLGKLSMATDEHFQSCLDKGKKQTLTPATAAAQNLITRANDHFKFELKRITYTFTTLKRESLIAEIDRYNTTLKGFLEGQDGIQSDSNLAMQSLPKKNMLPYRKLLSFWRDAHRIHRLMQEAWQCSCVSMHRAHLRLDQRRPDKPVGLDMTVRFSDTSVAPSPAPWKQISVAVSRSQPPQAPSTTNQTNPNNPRPAMVSFRLPSPSAQTLNPQTLTTGNLCLLIDQSQTSTLGTHICMLVDNAGGDPYEISKSATPINVEDAQSLFNVLANNCTIELLHKPRLVLAYNIASFFLKLCATPWLDHGAISKHVYLPVSPDRKRLSHNEAYLSSHFHHTDDSQPTDGAFALLGILLLELCFNKPLEQHPQWQAWHHVPDPVSDPMLRLAVATFWAKEVEDVWSLDGARAIHWCLHFARAKQSNWREEFARNVVEPIRTVCVNSGVF